MGVQKRPIGGLHEADKIAEFVIGLKRMIVGDDFRKRDGIGDSAVHAGSDLTRAIETDKRCPDRL